jgi:hypothetical protein
MSSTREMILRPALTGVIVGVASSVILGNAREPLLLECAVAIGASVAVGSLTAQAFNQFVVPTSHYALRGSSDTENTMADIWKDENK